MNRIILSVNEKSMYAWFVPTCALMWRDVADFRVSCIFVGAVNPWLIEKSREVGVDVYTVPAEAFPCGSSTAGQLARLYSYLLPGVEPDDYLLSVDSDAWPLASAPFQPSGALLDLTYPDVCDRMAFPTIPIGYIGAKAATWREFMKLEGPRPEDAVRELFATHPMLISGQHNGWNFDEYHVTTMIKAWHGYPGQTKIVRRSGEPCVDRVDRIAWPANPTRKGKIDAHLLRPGWTDENWPRLRPLLAECLTPEHLAWVEQYKLDWTMTYGTPE